MAQSLDPSAFMDIFKAEADELFLKLQHGLLSLEKNPDQPALIEEVFRVAHTLKGSARMMGLLDIQEVAHHVEDLFDRVKKRELVLTPHITDRALAAIDTMSGIVSATLHGEPGAVNITETVQALQRAGGNAAVDAPKAAEPAAPTHEQPKVSAGRAEEFIRLPLSKIDALFNLAGELVVHKVKSSYKLQKLRQLTRQTKTAHKRVTELLEHESLDGGDRTASLQSLREFQLDAENLRRAVSELSELLTTETMQLDPVVDELQYRVRQLRMLPCSTIFDGLERLVRDTAHQLQKEVQLEIEGEETELDKKLLEAVKPCLVHLLRNSVDHGIESPDQRVARGKPRSGTIRLRAAHEGGKAIIEVQDDGAGLDLERIKQVALARHVVTSEQLERMEPRDVMDLIFAAGFSTAAIVTDVSGRGVGMDVVKKQIDSLKGHLLLDSRPGEGTTVRLELPLTVAIMEVLMVEAGGQCFGLPVLAIEEIVSVTPAEVQTIENRMAITWRDRTVPVVALADALELPAASDPAAAIWPVVIVNWSERHLGLRVDEVLSTDEVFVKGLPGHLGQVQNVSGAAILGTGQVVIILDVQGLVISARRARSSAPAAATPPAKPRPRILIVEDSITTREFERNLLEAHGYEVDTAMDGVDALEKVERGPFDLIVCDIEMPRMNGFDFCRNLRQREQFKALPVVIVTTRDKDEDKRQGVEVGAQAYIVKAAFNQDSLLDTIQRLIG